MATLKHFHLSFSFVHCVVGTCISLLGMAFKEEIDVSNLITAVAVLADTALCDCTSINYYEMTKDRHFSQFLVIER